MRILVLGSSGFLGSYLGFALPRLGHDVSGISRRDVPFFPDNHVIPELESVANEIGAGNYDIVINCIAVASHEACEADPIEADKVNATLPGTWAAAARESKTGFVQISTDAVFDGNSTELYEEGDVTTPESVYGKTKGRGEQMVLASHPQALILRTNFFGWSRNHTIGILDFFVNALSQQSSITGFQDYVVSSLYVGDLVDAMLGLANRKSSGVFHAVSSTPLSKYEFGQMVAGVMGLSDHSMAAGSIAEATGLAPRGRHLGLSVAKIRDALGTVMPSTEQGIHRALAERGALMDYFGVSKE